MGVSCITLWDPPDPGMDLSTAVINLQKKMEKIGAKNCGNWVVDCETYQSSLTVANPQKVMHLLHASEYPCTSFAIMEKPPAPGSTGSTGSPHCLVADHAFDLIMQNLKGFYAPRKGHKMEAKGHRFRHEHYVIKIASVTYGASNRGILVEVEDTTTSTIVVCWERLGKFVQALLQQSSPPAPPSKLQGEGEYAPSDQALTYLQIFGKLRKSPR